MNTLLEKYGGSDDRVAIFSHGVFFNYNMAAVLKLDERPLWFYANNTGITRIDFNGSGVTLGYFSRTENLPGEYLTRTLFELRYFNFWPVEREHGEASQLKGSAYDQGDTETESISQKGREDGGQHRREKLQPLSQ